jgi:hypothetical protein
MDARGAGLHAAEEMMVRTEREARLARRTRDQMLAMLADKWRLLGTNERDIRIKAQGALVGTSEEIRKKSLIVFSDLLREERARREAADIALGGAHTGNALHFFNDVVAHLDAVCGDMLTMWNILHKFHNDRRVMRDDGSLPILAMYAGPGANVESPATAETVPLRALATLVSTKVQSPESISAFGMACYVADGVMTYEGFRSGMRRCEMVDDGWGELDAEEAAMSAADRANVRESVTRAWTRLDRARAVLDGINREDMSMQRLAPNPPPLVVHTLGVVAYILRSEDAGLIEGIDHFEDGDNKAAAADAHHDDDTLEVAELRAEWAIVQRMLSNPVGLYRIESS